MKPKFSYKHLIINMKSLNKLKITGILCILFFASAGPLFPGSDAVSNFSDSTHRMTKTEVKNKLESAVSNKVYFNDFSGRLTNADKQVLGKIVKESRDKGFTLYMYTINLGKYKTTRKIVSSIVKRLGFEELELLIVLDAHKRGGFVVGSEYLSKEKQKEIAKKSLRYYFQNPPSGRSKYGMALENFSLAIVDKSNFKQSIFQFSFTVVILIILGVIVVIVVTIVTARKLKQKSFRDKLDKARDLLFEINSRHGDLKETNEYFINWSSQIEAIETTNNWKNQSSLNTLLQVMQSYLDNPNQSREEIIKPLEEQVIGNIRLEKKKRDDNKEYYCYSTGEPITSPEIYIATIKQDDGSELRVTLSEKTAKEVMKNPSSMQVRSYMHEGKPTPWYNVPDYRYDPYDRSYMPIFWYSLGSMGSHRSGYGYGHHSGYYVHDNDYYSYHDVTDTGSSFADQVGADSADDVAGSGFSDSSTADDSVGSSFSDNS